MVLTDLNTNVHKSVNQFLIDATDAYNRKLEGNELTNEEKAQPEEHLYITREDLEKMLDTKVNLKVWVKVKEDWLNNDAIVKKFKLK